MKILILSNTAWNNNNSFGNTFSNLFDDMPDIEIANIYCRADHPNNNIVKKYYQITEKSLIANLKNTKTPSGKEIFVDSNDIGSLNVSEQNVFNYMRKNRLQIFFRLRDLIWKIGRWKSADLEKFIIDFNPDIIYLPIYYSNYLCEIGRYLKEKLQIPMIGHITDDIYTLKQIRFSPLYWLNHFKIRRKVKWLVKHCEFVDTFSDIQKNEYEKIFNIPFNIRYKYADIIDNLPKAEFHFPIKFVFTGNISSGRWKTLSKLGNVISSYNKKEKKFELDIYTATPLNKKMKKSLNIPGAINFMGEIPYEKVKMVQSSADILVHAENFALKEALSVRMSFSTKIIDYLSKGKCIFAIGPGNITSIDYLIKNDAAIVASTFEDIETKIKDIYNDFSIINKYGEKSWECAKRNHPKEELKKNFYNDLGKLIK